MHNSHHVSSPRRCTYLYYYTAYRRVCSWAHVLRSRTRNVCVYLSHRVQVVSGNYLSKFIQMLFWLQIVAKLVLLFFCMLFLLYLLLFACGVSHFGTWFSLMECKLRMAYGAKAEVDRAKDTDRLKHVLNIQYFTNGIGHPMYVVYNFMGKIYDLSMLWCAWDRSGTKTPESKEMEELKKIYLGFGHTEYYSDLLL